MKKLIWCTIPFILLAWFFAYQQMSDVSMESDVGGDHFVYVPVASNTLRKIKLTPFASGFNEPRGLVAHPTNGRFYVIERYGTVRIVEPDGTVLPTPLIDVSDQIVTDHIEQGLLGLAFHPNFEQNGYIYLSYIIHEDDSTRIARFVADSEGTTANRDTEYNIFQLPQPDGNHNGGDIHFGPDGYLYIGLGDGGGANDRNNYASNPAVLYGKMVRIDVDMNGDNPVDCGLGNYTIPADNPYAYDDYSCREIWMIGLRNPWRFTFDAENGDMYIADVGQNGWEEINFFPGNTIAGNNYGWNCLEGYEIFNEESCGDLSGYTYPIYAYSQAETSGCAVIGGHVYRGRRYPAMNGHYFFSDFCTGEILTLHKQDGGWFTQSVLGPGTLNPTAMGIGVDGELYLVDFVGTIYHIEPDLQ
ncbi:MAG TPA: PQQ-dependent sugar dehydrogenase [Anaerolineae bacterium]|nr:PQQ-dependent sugar dehydrogenase [Anaerolineae bacterium]